MAETPHTLRGTGRSSWRLWIYLAVGVALGAFWWGWMPHKRAKADPWDFNNLPLARSEDDPISSIAGSVDFMTATDLALTMGIGSGWHGYDTIQIKADGHCRYTFRDEMRVTQPDGSPTLGLGWRQAEFQIGPQTLMDLRKLLVEIDFFRLKRAYHANVWDGSQRWAKVEACGKQKRVYCDNHFPAEFQKLHTFVRERVLRPQEIALKNAPVINPSREELHALWSE